MFGLMTPQISLTRSARRHTGHLAKSPQIDHAITHCSTTRPIPVSEASRPRHESDADPFGPVIWAINTEASRVTSTNRAYPLHLLLQTTADQADERDQGGSHRAADGSDSKEPPESVSESSEEPHEGETGSARCSEHGELALDRGQFRWSCRREWVEKDVGALDRRFAHVKV
jgi:hypothetical protein